jgi:undecaprenyl diphosphate synthase
MTQNLPNHIAIIMDGNGRWAKKRGWKRIRGHEKGVRSVRETVTECAAIGVRELTLYALSSENFTRRPRIEVSFLMKMLHRYVLGEEKTRMDNNIAFRTIGRVGELPAKVRKAIDNLTEISSGNTGMVLRLALNYGGRREILDAIVRLVEARPSIKDLDEDVFRKFFYDPEMSDPDLLVRTGGDLRVSNFLLWQVSYSEIYSTKVLWPDFSKAHLHEAIDEFNRRERRFGGIGK